MKEKENECLKSLFGYPNRVKLPPRFHPVHSILFFNIFQTSAKVSMIWILWTLLPHPLHPFPGHYTLATESDQLLLGLPWHTHAPGHLHGCSHSKKALPPDVTWITASFLKTFNFSGRSLIVMSKISTPSSTCVISPFPASLFLFNLYFALTPNAFHFCGFCFLTMSSTRMRIFV